MKTSFILLGLLALIFCTEYATSWDLKTVRKPICLSKTFKMIAKGIAIAPLILTQFAFMPSTYAAEASNPFYFGVGRFFSLLLHASNFHTAYLLLTQV